MKTDERRALCRQPLMMPAVFLVLVIAVQTRAQRAYWAVDAFPEFVRIQRANLDGTELHDLVHTGHIRPESLAVDPVEGKLYWKDEASSNKVTRASFDGSEVEDVFAPSTFTIVLGITVDPVERKLYWYADAGQFEKIYRANLDGTQVEDVVTTGVGDAWDLAVDPIGRKIYWANGYIYRANLDGSNLETVFGILFTSATRGIALDVDAGKVYWTDISTQKVQRANLDGSQVEDLVTATSGAYFPWEIALHVPTGKMYWIQGQPGQVMRANLDGSQVEELIVTDFVQPRGMAVDEVAGKIYFGGDTSILRADLDGTNVEGVIVTDHISPRYLALDLEDNRMYWADFYSRKIRRSALDGSHIQALVDTRPRSPMGIGLDVPRGKVYWTEFLWGPVGGPEDPAAAIRRANLDGSNVEPLVGEEYGSPFALALDLPRDHMYWVTDLFAIHRANLDGTNVQPERITGAETWGIAVDSQAQKLYWSTANFKGDFYRIRRSNLDGSGVQDLRNSYAIGLGLDLIAGKMYWTQFFAYAIRRANLDGTNGEIVIQPLPNSDDHYGIAIDPRVPGDCNGDRATTMADDWPSFFGCLAGPEVEFTPGCACADPNGDRDVDLRDFADLQQRLVPNE